jgi:hypothetical protein
MYTNHVTSEYGKSVVELNIMPEERRALPVGARQALRALGTMVDDGIGGREEVWHLSHNDALAIEAIIDEAAGA